LFRKETEEERVRNRRSARLQKGSGRWIKIVRKKPGKEKGRNRRRARLQKGIGRWLKIF
jgi:hypothetical protein